MILRESVKPPLTLTDTGENNPYRRIRRCLLMNNRECFSLHSRAESSRAELVSNRESRETQHVRSCVGSLDNTRRFHADAIATFLRRDTVIRYGITFTLLIMIINVILYIIFALVMCAPKSGKREKERRLLHYVILFKSYIDVYTMFA